ncbi:hypothetical protein U1Q18_036460 [Sarracenia purpurea var. burkii]
MDKKEEVDFCSRTSSEGPVELLKISVTQEISPSVPGGERFIEVDDKETELEEAECEFEEEGRNGKGELFANEETSGGGGTGSEDCVGADLDKENKTNMIEA